MLESHSGLYDVGIAESWDYDRFFPNPAVLKFSIQQLFLVQSYLF